jgi:poly(beta-D-mannuronate) lyase
MRNPTLSGTRRVVLGAMAGALALGRGAGRAAAPQRLISPIDVEARRKLCGRPSDGFACEPAPAPVIDLSIVGAYVDKAYSVVDPALKRKQAEAARPVEDFCWRAGRIADEYMLSRPKRPEPAACLLTWLDTWARANAMLGRLDTADAQHHRRWVLCGLGLAYLKIRDAPGIDPAARMRVEQWFVKLANQASAYYNQWGQAGYNNHADWWALALAVTAVAARDQTMFAYAMSLYDILVSDIQPDGTLPKEMARKSRALGYHIFALTPLVLLAEIGEVNGRDLYAAQGGAIHRLARRVLAGCDDPDWFAQRAGAPQEPFDARSLAFRVIWAEMYYPRFPDPDLARRIVPYRPLSNPWLGGSVTYAFGSPALPMPA